MARSQLDVFLAAMYRADVMKEGSLDEATRLTRKLLAASQPMMEEARRRQQELRPVVKKRGTHVHVEKKTLEYLDMLLDERAPA